MEFIWFAMLAQRVSQHYFLTICNMASEKSAHADNPSTRAMSDSHATLCQTLKASKSNSLTDDCAQSKNWALVPHFLFGACWRPSVQLSHALIHQPVKPLATAHSLAHAADAPPAPAHQPRSPAPPPFSPAGSHGHPGKCMAESQELLSAPLAPISACPCLTVSYLHGRQLWALGRVLQLLRYSVQKVEGLEVRGSEACCSRGRA
jgi:hypothetical protein